MPVTNVLTRPVTFLHLTDCHFTGDKTSQASWRALLAFLREELSPKPDYVFVTGDVADRNADDGYLFAREFFSELSVLLTLGSGGIFVVPGNHDLDRGLARFIVADATRLAELLSPESRDAAHLPFMRFKRAIAEAGIVGHDLRERVSDTGRSDVRVLLINTSWLARDSKLDHGRLSISIEAWETLLGPTASQDTPFTVALLHHSPEWLDPAEVRRVERLLCRHADVVLSGHHHEEYIKEVSVDGYSCVLVSGASVGASDLPHHRAILGRVESDGVACFDRVLRDPQRSGTSDEWYVAPSQRVQRVRRVDETLMRSPVVAKSYLPLDALREMWGRSFQKDALVGVAERTDPRDLVVLYRKLTLAKRSDDSGYSDISLWHRMRGVLDPVVLGAIATDVESSLKLASPGDVVSALQEQRTSRLTGDAQADKLALATSLKRSLAMRAYSVHTRALGIDAEKLLDSELFLSTMVAFPEKILEEASENMQALASDPSSATLGRLQKSLWLAAMATTLLQAMAQSDDVSGSVLSEAHAVILSAIGACVPVPTWQDSLHFLFLAAPVTFIQEFTDHIIALGKGDHDLLVELANYGVPQSVLSPTMMFQLRARDGNAWGIVINEMLRNSLTTVAAPPLMGNARLLWAARSSTRDTSRPDLIALGLVLASSAAGRGATHRAARCIALLTRRVVRRNQLLPAVTLRAPRATLKRILTDRVFSELRYFQPFIVVAKILRDRRVVPADVAELAKHLVEESFRDALLETTHAPSLNLEEIRAMCPTAFAILGNPGTGKTTLLRHLCLTCSENDIPVFAPLKHWNNTITLDACVDFALVPAGLTLEKLELQVTSDRRLLVLLDGLDEVSDLSGDKQMELSSFVERIKGHGQVIVTSRPGAARWLPRDLVTEQYTLNRLSTDDVADFLHAWYGSDTEQAREALSQVKSDRSLLEEVRTPFVLRMFCAMKTNQSPRTWSARTSMYNAIANYLLDERDRAREIPLAFDLATKRQALARIAQVAVEQGLSLVGAHDAIEIVRECVPNRDRNIAVTLLAEIVQRSHLLIKVSESAYDFSHFILREFFAVQAWSQNEDWERWDRAQVRAYLIHESVARFIVGFNRAACDRVVSWLRDAMSGAPVIESLVGNVRLEIFRDQSVETQLAYMAEFLEAATTTAELHPEESLGTFAQMFHMCADPVRAADIIVGRLNELTGQNESDARLLLLASAAEDERVARSVAALLKSEARAIDSTIRATLARMGPARAGQAVRNLVADRLDLALLRECLMNAPEWTQFLRKDIERLLDEKKSGLANVGGMDLTGIDIPDDGSELLVQTFQDISKSLFAQTSDLTTTDPSAEMLLELRRRVGDEAVEQLRASWLRSALSNEALRLSAHEAVVVNLADLLGIPVRASASGDGLERKTDTFEEVLEVLVDVADEVAVKLIVGRLVRSADSKSQRILRAAIGKMLRRFEHHRPLELIDLCRQLVDDLWVVAHSERSGRDPLVVAKEHRLAHLKSELGVPQTLWDAVAKVVRGLPRRPVRADWAFLQHRFGTLIRTLKRIGSGVGESAVTNRVISEDLWQFAQREIDGVGPPGAG